MYLLQIKLFVFLLILSTATAPSFVNKLFGSSKSSKRAAKHEDAKVGKNGSARKTDDHNTSLDSMNQSAANQEENRAQVATCKSQLSSEGYYDNVKNNWLKAQSIKSDMSELNGYGNEQYEQLFGVRTACGRIYSEMLVVVEDSKSDAFKELKGASGFCATFSGCVTQIAGENNYYADDDDQYSYY